MAEKSRMTATPAVFIQAEFIGMSTERKAAKAAPKLAMDPEEPTTRRIQPKRNAGRSP
jgi:hypothetical protein